MSSGTTSTVHRVASIPFTLAEALRKREVVPFVGAGVSRAVVKRGTCPPVPLLPSWGELLERAADALDREAKPYEAMAVRGQLKKTKPDYLRAASEARDGLNAQWTHFLKDEIDCRDEDAGPESLQLATALWRLGSPLLITTNYDHVLKWTCPKPQSYVGWLTNPQAELAQLHKAMGSLPPGSWPKRPTVWHLHGHIDHAAELVLAPDGYDRLYPKTTQVHESWRAALQTLKMLLLSRVFLFVGFSLDDVCFLSVLKEIQHDFSNCGLTHYALIRESECAKIQEKIGNLPIQLLSFRDFGDPLLQRVLSLANTVSATEPDEEAAQPDEIRTLAHTIPPTSTSEGACGQPLPSSSAIRSMVTRASYDQLAAHYLELAPDLRNNIARRLGLLPANYLSLNRVELSKQIFLAAHVQNQFAALWTAVEERHPEGKPTPNPFST